MSTGSAISIVGIGLHIGEFDSTPFFASALFEGKQTTKSVESIPKQEDLGINGAILGNLSKRQIMLCEVVLEALADSGIPLTQELLRRTAFIDVCASSGPVEENTETDTGQSARSDANVDITGDFVKENIWLRSIWNIQGPCVTVDGDRDAFIRSLTIARDWLDGGNAEYVVLATSQESIAISAGEPGEPHLAHNLLSYSVNAKNYHSGEGAAAIFLTRRPKNATLKEGGHDPRLRIYADIAGITSMPLPPRCRRVADLSRRIEDTIRKMLVELGGSKEFIAYFASNSSGLDLEDKAELSALSSLYNDSKIKCALGSVKSNIGNVGIVSDLAELITCALALFYRYIPPTPNWTESKYADVVNGSGLYIATESQPWDVPPGRSLRCAAANFLTSSNCSIVTLYESGDYQYRNRLYFSDDALLLFPVADNSPDGLLDRLDTLLLSIDQGADFHELAADQYEKFKRESGSPYIVCLVAKDPGSLRQEIGKSRKGLPKAMQQGRVWQTPQGSYYWPATLRKHKKKVCFVYPGAFNAYPGLGRKLFLQFPFLYSTDTEVNGNGKLPYDTDKVFHKSFNKPSFAEVDEFSKKIATDTSEMLKVGISYACLMTRLLEHYCSLTPSYAMGYSLGELSMLFATGVFQRNYETMLKSSSSLLTNRITTNIKAAYEYWNVASEIQVEGLWANFVVLTGYQTLAAVVKKYKKVFITHINAPDEMVIAGDPVECRQVISELGCRSHSVPVPHLFHTPVIESERDALRSLLRFPVQKPSGIRLYTSFNSKTLALESNTIASDIAESLLQPVDFQNLVESIYDDGANVFVELGPANTCTRWIGETLKGKEHIAVAMNSRGTDERSSIVKALAKLICFGVDLDFSFVYQSSRNPLRESPENMECLFMPDEGNSAEDGNEVDDIGGYRNVLESKLVELQARRRDLDKEHMGFLLSRHTELKKLQRRFSSKQIT